MSSVSNLFVALVLVISGIFHLVEGQYGNSSQSLEDDIFIRRNLITTGAPIMPPPSNYRYICQEDQEELERSNKHLGIRCRCPTIRAPVCGSDNVTYRNRCFMHCRAQHATDVYHRYKLTLKKFGEC